MCEHCGDSGVLNILASIGVHERDWDDRAYAAACHACPRGVEMGALLGGEVGA